MILSAILQYLSSLPLAVLPILGQATGSVAPEFQGCGPGVYCPTSAFTAVGAAYATLGYWIHADMIYYLTLSQFGLWAPMLYCLAAAGGMISLAMGSAPKNYMWFFLGPAIYSFLLGTTERVHGVEWQVAGVPQDQREVWRQSEIGLQNSNMAARLRENGGVRFSSIDAPTRAVEVSSMFLWYDEVVSSSVQWLIRWTGVYNMRGNDEVSSSDTSTAITVNSSTGQRFEAGEWHLISPLKWTYLEDITSAKLTSPDLRDAFISFMSSDCGDVLSRAISPQALAASTNNKANSLPSTAFIGGASSSTYENVLNSLYRERAEIPDSLRAFIKQRDSVVSLEGDIGSFRQFVPSWNTTFDYIIRDETHNDINCGDYFQILVQGFRWEAGGIYYQLTSPMYTNLTREDVVYNLFYGWDIKKCPGDSDDCDVSRRQAIQTTDELDRFMQDLVLVHLFRNELAIAPHFYDVRFSGTETTENYVKSAQRSVSSKSKFGEVYVWAMMMPYLQGLLLYVLSMAYPFCCVMLVLPGWHSIILTWMSFWAWAKLWDVGFAIVLVLERSIWAQLGNGTHFKTIADKVLDMQNWAHIGVICPAGSDAGGCSIPIVCDGSCGSTVVASATSLMRIFDRAMIIGSNLDLDLANSYYIYLMSGLYFAVPAITGQIVLGSKSGASSMIGTMIGGVASDAGRAGGQGYGGDISQRLNSAGAALDQTSYNKGLRGGLAERALGYQNKGAELDAVGQRMGNDLNAYRMMNDLSVASNSGAGYALDTVGQVVGQSVGLATSPVFAKDITRQARDPSTGMPIWEANGTPRMEQVRQTSGPKWATGFAALQGARMAASSLGGLDTMPDGAGVGRGMANHRRSDGRESPIDPSRLGQMFADIGGDESATGEGSVPEEILRNGSDFFRQQGSGPGAGGTAAAAAMFFPGVPRSANPAPTAAAPTGGGPGTPTTTTPSGGGGGAGGGAGGAGGAGGSVPVGATVRGSTAGEKAAVLAGAQMAVTMAEAKYKLYAGLMAQQMAFDRIEGDTARAQLGTGLQSKGYGMAGQRYSQFAEGRAHAGQWAAHNRWATQAGGWSAATGVLTGALSAGPKPMGMEYSSMAGMAGSGARAAAWWSDPGNNKKGSYFDTVSSQMAKAFGGDDITKNGFIMGYGQAFQVLGSTFITPHSNFAGKFGDQISGYRGADGKLNPGLNERGQAGQINMPAPAYFGKNRPDTPDNPVSDGQVKSIPPPNDSRLPTR